MTSRREIPPRSPLFQSGEGRKSFLFWFSPFEKGGVRGGFSSLLLLFLLFSSLLPFVACGDDDSETEDGAGRATQGRGGRSGGDPAGGFGGPPGGAPPSSGVPVEVTTATRQPIAQYFETNGTLEAEHDVDLVARVTGPIVELRAEEGQRVREGQLLARIDASEVRAQLAVAQVRLEETRSTLERRQSLYDNDLISKDELETARAAYDSALGDVERNKIQLEYTAITAPFSGQLVRRYIRESEFVAAGTPLFRISDFDPLLVPIQIPERELSRLRLGQPAQVTVEAWPEERFPARVLRLSPVIDADTGTIRVVLEVDGTGKLRPGMFGSVFLEMDSRPDALVIPKQALALDSLGDTVFVADDGVARRRPIEIGFESSDRIEVTSGLQAGERVVVAGQDGLSDGTPIEVLEDGRRPTGPAPPAVVGGPPGTGSPGGAPGTGPPGGDRPGAGEASGRGGREGGPGGFLQNVDLDDPEQVERVKGLMRQRGLSDEQIEERLKQIRERRAQQNPPQNPTP